MAMGLGLQVMSFVCVLSAQTPGSLPAYSRATVDVVGDNAITISFDGGPSASFFMFSPNGSRAIPNRVFAGGVWVYPGGDGVGRLSMVAADAANSYLCKGKDL
jgi:hypothetical protein